MSAIEDLSKAVSGEPSRLMPYCGRVYICNIPFTYHDHGNPHVKVGDVNELYSEHRHGRVDRFIKDHTIMGHTNIDGILYDVFHDHDGPETYNDMEATFVRRKP